MEMGHYDSKLGSKLRQIQRELKEWAEKAKKNKLRLADIERMELESELLRQLISNKEL